MRTRVLVLAVTAAILLAMSSVAQAKGFERGRVTITGPSMSDPIRLRGAEAAAYLAGAGLLEQKWPVPNIDSTLDPSADLGTAYLAVVSLDCGSGVRATFRQTLYPDAPGGLQILTDDGATWCFGEGVGSGYWPAGDDVVRLLAASGLPATAPRATPEASSDERAAMPSRGGSGPRGPIGALAASALVVGVALLVMRRRRSTIAARGL